MTSDNESAIRRRNALTSHLKREGIIHSPSVEAAFRAVPRHLFVPQAALWHAYADEALPLKEEGGQRLSAISQPAMVAIMLEQLDLQPGQNVLEIGAGAGYNAALMAHIVGESGHVVTLDIDDDLVHSARAHLAATGVINVTALTADGAHGCAEFAPYDRIVLTVGAADIAPAWRDQCKLGGRMVLPIDFANVGIQFSIAFDKTDDCLVAQSYQPCGFIKLRGAMAPPESQPQRPSQPEPTKTASPAAPRIPSFGEVIASSITHLLPKVGHEMWRRRMNRQVFGRPSLAGLSVRAYPTEAGYRPAENEVIHDQPATRFVVRWDD